MNVNTVHLAGRVGQKPEVETTPGGSQYCRIGLATTETWKDSNGIKQEKTQWHNVIFWGRTAEVLAQYVVKGQVIYVQGSLDNQEWERDGVKHRRTEIKGRLMQMGQKPNGNGQSAPPPADPQIGITDDDIPF